jgi:hypothetical protein
MAPRPSGRRALLIWAVTATLAAVVFANIALLLWVRLRQANATMSQQVASRRDASASGQSNTSAVEPVGAFANLQESEVAGRYRFFQDGEELGTITLLPSHSIINKDGTTYPRYHWEIRPEGILTVWQRGEILLNVMEKPGVYIALKKDGTQSLRIEKLEK